MRYLGRVCGVLLLITTSVYATQLPPTPNTAVATPVIAERGAFDADRWNAIIENIWTRATADGVSEKTIKSTLRYPAYIPSIVHRDKNQSEFKLTMDDYLARMVRADRIKQGRKMRVKYPTLLSRVEQK
ncbi:MAG: lytic murein transglycosylase, partial [Alphaproteobacteria bacterium]|nr:lytic murein transglycosylase [Alphaproteobacteria bacterium]